MSLLFDRAITYTGRGEAEKHTALKSAPPYFEILGINGYQHRQKSLVEALGIKPER